MIRFMTIHALLFFFSLTSSAAPKFLNFEQLYKREKAQLNASKQSLSQELKRLTKAQSKTRLKKRALLDQLSKEIRLLRKENEGLDEELIALEQSQQSSQEHKELFSATLIMAQKRLAGFNQKVDPKLPEDEQLAHDVKYAAALIKRFSTVYPEQGKFYLPNGEEVNGTIIRMGRIAALGIAQKHAGVLALAPSKDPNGAVELKLIDESDSKQAQSIAGGETLDLTPIYLFDPECKGVHNEAKSKTLVDTTKAGGPIAWIIVILAIFGLLLVIERIFTLYRLSNRKKHELPQAIADIEAQKFDQAKMRLSQMGALGRVIAPLVELKDKKRQVLEEYASENLLKMMPYFDRSMALITVIVAVAPLLGLLGTVSGMISTFDVITEHGTGDPKLLSHGISEALITTKFGLSVAVPMLLLKTFVSRWADRMVDAIQTTSLSVINALDYVARKNGKKD